LATTNYVWLPKSGNPPFQAVPAGLKRASKSGLLSPELSGRRAKINPEIAEAIGRRLPVAEAKKQKND